MAASDRHVGQSLEGAVPASVVGVDLVVAREHTCVDAADLHVGGLDDHVGRDVVRVRDSDIVTTVVASCDVASGPADLVGYHSAEDREHEEKEEADDNGHIVGRVGVPAGLNAAFAHGDGHGFTFQVREDMFKIELTELDFPAAKALS